MAETPEEVYQRVLQEEQDKGSSPPVAEGRAKAARMRASKGLPTDPAGAAAAASSGGEQAQESETPAPEAPAAQAPAQPAAAAPAASGGEDPEKAFERVLAEEKAKGSSPPVAEGRAKAARMKAKKAAAQPAGGPAAPAPQAKAAAGAPAAAAAAPAAATATAPEANPERIQRLLAVVKPEAIQRVEKEPMDRVNVWPHLMAAEFLSLIAVTAFLVVFSTFVNAPFLELANINVTPNPSKAPWYFLGLQELLRYFHPQVAGVTIPQWLIVAGIVLPYVDRNPSSKPEDRKLAIVLFTIFLVMSAVLAIIGSLFRGPGFNFIYPWDVGIFFEL